MQMIDLPFAGVEFENLRRALAHNISKIEVRAGNNVDVSFSAEALSYNFQYASDWVTEETDGIKSIDLKYAGDDFECLRNEIAYFVNKCLVNTAASKELVSGLLLAGVVALEDYVEPTPGVDAPVYIGDDDAVSFIYTVEPETKPAGIEGFLTPEGYGAAVVGGQLVYEDNGSNFTGDDVVVSIVAKSGSDDITLPHIFTGTDVQKNVTAKEVGTNAGGSTDGYVLQPTNLVVHETYEFAEVPTLTDVTGGAGQLSFTITGGASRPGTRYRVNIPGAPGDGSGSAGRYEYETDGSKTVTGLTAGSYNVSIIRVWNAVGQIITAVDGGDATVS